MLQQNLAMRQVLSNQNNSYFVRSKKGCMIRKQFMAILMERFCSQICAESFKKLTGFENH